MSTIDPLTATQLGKIVRDMLNMGMSKREVAESFQRSVSTVNRWLRAYVASVAIALVMLAALACGSNVTPPMKLEATCYVSSRADAPTVCDPSSGGTLVNAASAYLCPPSDVPPVHATSTCVANPAQDFQGYRGWCCP